MAVDKAGESAEDVVKARKVSANDTDVTSTAKQTAGSMQAGPEPATPDPAIYLTQMMSFNSAKRNNISLLNGETAMIAAGSIVVLLHLPSMQQRYLPGQDGGGVAAVAVHPSMQYLMVAEKCRTRPPNIYIYQYPSLDLCQTLPGGTEQAYSCAAFSADGSMLASVGSAPDYMLTLWDWRTAGTLLRCKAFSQEVYSVRFSPHFPGNLVTCGTGHIRFWKMATTFTGLKLQGHIGKFGSQELSDIAAFIELPDGKVLSGCESGALLLWDGGLITAVITRPKGAACHDGPVEVLCHDPQTNYILSGGGDGMLRLWDFTRVNDAAPADGSSTCEVKPAAEVALPGHGCIRGAVWSKRSWLVLTDAGALLQVSLPINLMDSKGYTISQVLDLHAGPLLGAYTCPGQHILITGAGDGTIRAMNYKSQLVLQQCKFSDRASCMAMVPMSADQQQRTVIVGFANGTLRMVRRCADGWRLLAAARPHKSTLSHVCISPDGGRVAAVAVDGGVFFFQLNHQTLEPQLSCQLPSVGPTCCCWSPDSKKVLLGFSNGMALELAVHEIGAMDTSRTYQQELASRSYMAKLPQRPKSPQQHDQQQSSATQPACAGQQADAADTSVGCAAAQSADSDGHNNHSTAVDAEQEQAQQQQQRVAGEMSSTEPFAEQSVLPITWISYIGGDVGKFRLWVGGGPAAGQVLECDWEQQTAVSSSAGVPGAAVTAVSSSWSGKYSLLGSSDGIVRLEDTQLQDGQVASRYWQCPLHDMHDGQVTAVAMAYDNSCFITAAIDGTMLLLANPLPADPHTVSADETDCELPTMLQDAAGQPEVVDVSAASPTLEEAKQAAQHSMQAAAAAAAREQLVGAVKTMQGGYAALLAANNARRPAERVHQHMLRLDAGLIALVERERAHKLADARAQVAFQADMAQLKLNKLQQYFTSNLAVPHIQLFSMSGGSSISTLRQAEMPKTLQLAVEDAEREHAQHQHARQQLHETQDPLRRRTSDAHTLETVHLPDTSQHHSGTCIEDLQPSLPGHNASCATSRADVWRQAKNQRAADWAAFNASRPDETYEAPDDIAALSKAAATIGDYKLKSDPGHMLPVDQRLTPARKRQQMLMMTRDMVAAQSTYNAQVLGLRAQKQGLVGRLNDMRRRVQVINKLLDLSEHLSELTMRPEEEPGQQFSHLTAAQLAQHQAAKKLAADKAASSGATAGLGGFVASGTGTRKAATHEEKKKPMESATHVSSAMSSDGTVHSVALTAASLKPSERRKLQIERQQLLGDMSAAQMSFDATLAACRMAQLELSISLKAAEGQLLLMMKELEVLKEAEVRENVLEDKLAAKAEEQAELAGRLADVGRTLDAKRAEGDSAAAQRAAVVAELGVVLAEQGSFKEQLIKVFNRKMKRGRRYNGGVGAGGDESGSDFDVADEEGDDDDDDNSDEEEGSEVCPPGCEPSLYERVVELRQRRLDADEAAAEVNKVLEGIKKERELLMKKAKLIDQSLTAISQNVLEFQQEKQARLNQLPATVSLKLHQVTHLEGAALPADMSDALVFSAVQLTSLKARLQELDAERSELRQQQTGLQRQHGQLQADQAVKQMRLSELNAKCKDVQMLKFGQVIDVTLLDAIGVRNKGADELREALKQQTRTATKQLEAWDVKIAAKRRELLHITHENTCALNTVTDLISTQRHLEASVMAGRIALWQDPLDARRKALAERDKLVSTINERARTLDNLRSRIAALKHKDAVVNA